MVDVGFARVKLVVGFSIFLNSLVNSLLDGRLDFLLDRSLVFSTVGSDGIFGSSRNWATGVSEAGRSRDETGRGTALYKSG